MSLDITYNKKLRRWVGELVVVPLGQRRLVGDEYVRAAARSSLKPLVGCFWEEDLCAVAVIPSGGGVESERGRDIGTLKEREESFYDLFPFYITDFASSQ
jgi:hypothetical protein